MFTRGQKLDTMDINVPSTPTHLLDSNQCIYFLFDHYIR